MCQQKMTFSQSKTFELSDTVKEYSINNSIGWSGRNIKGMFVHFGTDAVDTKGRALLTEDELNTGYFYVKNGNGDVLNKIPLRMLKIGACGDGCYFEIDHAVCDVSMEHSGVYFPNNPPDGKVLEVFFVYEHRSKQS